MVKSHRLWIIAARMIIACAVLGSTAFGQPEAPSEQAKNSLRDGKSALLYEIVGDFDLTSFEGANLSYKRHYTDNRAYRIGVGVFVSHENEDQDASGSRWAENEITQYWISLTALKLHYLGIGDRSSFYWGLGPRIGYSHEKYAHDTPAWDDDYSSENTLDRANAGIVCALGAEWFLAREVSLLAQYGTVLEYNWSRREDRQTYVDPDIRDYFNNRESSTIELRADVVRFGLSFYW